MCDYGMFTSISTVSEDIKVLADSDLEDAGQLTLVGMLVLIDVVHDLEVDGNYRPSTADWLAAMAMTPDDGRRAARITLGMDRPTSRISVVRDRWQR